MVTGRMSQVATNEELQKDWDGFLSKVFSPKQTAVPTTPDWTLPEAIPTTNQIETDASMGGGWRALNFLDTLAAPVRGFARGLSEIEQEKRSGNFDIGDLGRPVGSAYQAFDRSVSATFLNDDVEQLHMDSTPRNLLRQYARGRKDPTGVLDDALVEKFGRETQNLSAAELEDYIDKYVAPAQQERMDAMSFSDKLPNYAMSFGTDVAMDPLTYATGGISALVKLAKAKQALKKAPQLADEAARVQAVQAPVAPAPGPVTMSTPRAPKQPTQTKTPGGMRVPAPQKPNVPAGVTPGQAAAAQNADELLNPEVDGLLERLGLQQADELAETPTPVAPEPAPVAKENPEPPTPTPSMEDEVSRLITEATAVKQAIPEAIDLGQDAVNRVGPRAMEEGIGIDDALRQVDEVAAAETLRKPPFISTLAQVPEEYPGRVAPLTPDELLADVAQVGDEAIGVPRTAALAEDTPFARTVAQVVRRGAPEDVTTTNPFRVSQAAEKSPTGRLIPGAAIRLSEPKRAFGNRLRAYVRSLPGGKTLDDAAVESEVADLLVSGTIPIVTATGDKYILDLAEVVDSLTLRSDKVGGLYKPNMLPETIKLTDDNPTLSMLQSILNPKTADEYSSLQELAESGVKFQVGEKYQPGIANLDVDPVQFIRGVQEAIKYMDDVTKTARTQARMEKVVQPSRTQPATRESTAAVSDAVNDVAKAEATPENVPTNSSPPAQPGQVVHGHKGGASPDKPVSIEELSQTYSAAQKAVETTQTKLDAARKDVAESGAAATPIQKAQVGVQEILFQATKDAAIPAVRITRKDAEDVWVKITDPMFKGKYNDADLPTLLKAFGDKNVVVGASSIDYGQANAILRGSKSIQNMFNYTSSGPPVAMTVPTVARPKGSKSISKKIQANNVEHADFVYRLAAQIEDELVEMGIPLISDYGAKIPMQLTERLAIAADDLVLVNGGKVVHPGYFLANPKHLLENGLINKATHDAIKLLSTSADYIAGKYAVNRWGVAAEPHRITKFEELHRLFPSLMDDSKSIRRPTDAKGRQSEVPDIPVKVETNEELGDAIVGAAQKAQVSMHTQRTKNVPKGQPVKKRPVAPRTPAQVRKHTPVGAQKKIAQGSRAASTTAVAQRYQPNDLFDAYGFRTELETLLEQAGRAYDFIAGPDSLLRRWSVNAGLRNHGMRGILFNSMGFGAALRGSIDQFIMDINKVKGTQEQVKVAYGAAAKIAAGGDKALIMSGLGRVEAVWDNLDSTFVTSQVSLQQLDKYLPSTGFKGRINYSGANIDDTQGIFEQILGATKAPGGGTARDYFFENPLQAIMQLETALNKAATEAMVINDLLYVVGKDTPQGLVNPVLLKGRYFEYEDATIIPRMLEVMDDIMVKTVKGNQFLAYFDEVQAIWKTSVTVVTPGHHIRNSMSNMFMALLTTSGFVNPAKAVANYRNAHAILHSKQDLYGNVFANITQEEVNAMMKSKLDGKPLAIPSRGGKNGGQEVYISVGGRKLTGDDIYGEFFVKGLATQGHLIPDLGTDAVSAGRNASSRVRNLPYVKQMGAVSTVNEHSARLAVFLDDIEVGLKKRFGTRKNVSDDEWQKAMDEITNESAIKIRKIMPDGLFLTNAEKSIMRRLIPFWTWNRAMIPAFIEAAAMRPGRLNFANNAYQNLQTVVTPGMADGSLAMDENDPALPDWVYNNYVMGPLLGIPTDQGTALIAHDPKIPMTDVPKMVTDPSGTARGLLTPLAKIPYELLSGREMVSGQPIEATEYAQKNIPIVSNISRVATGGSPGSKEGRWEGSKNFPWISQLFGQSFAEYNKPSAFESQNFEQQRKDSKVRKKEQKQEKKDLEQWRKEQGLG
jgi:hypothetical protein